MYELTEDLARETGLDYSKKKNRVIFSKDDRLLKVLGTKKKKTECFQWSEYEPGLLNWSRGGIPLRRRSANHVQAEK